MNAECQSYNYVLDWGKLRPCDIVLSRETLTLNDALNCPKRMGKAIVSRAIRAFTGPYSHAMIYFDKSIIHAEKPGVFSLNPQRVSVAAKDDLFVLRPVGMTNEMLAGIEAFCRERVGSLYDTREVVLVPFAGESERAPDTRQFCSRLVAQAYASVGVRLVDNPDYCAPSDFMESSVLTQVGSCSRPPSEDDLRILHSRDFVKENLCHTFAWLSVVRDYAAKDGVFVQTVKDAVEYLMGHHNADTVCADALQESGSLDDWRAEKSAHPYRYNPVLLAAAVRQGETSLQREVEMCQTALIRYEQMLLVITDCLASFKSSRFLELYKTLYLDLIRDLQTKAAVQCAVLAANCSMTPNPAILYAACSRVLAES